MTNLSQSPTELETPEEKSRSFICFESSDLLVDPCLISEHHNQLMLCSRIHCSDPDKSVTFSLYDVNHSHQPKLSTGFFPVKDSYTRIFASRTKNGFFAGFQTKNQRTYLTLFKITGQGFKKLTTLSLNSVGMKINSDALCFLENPFECLFLPGDGSLKYLDLRKKAILYETPCHNYEGLKYFSKLGIIAVKRKEELQLMKISPQKVLVPINKVITGLETLKYGLSKPFVLFPVTQYSDLKDYAFDEEDGMLYTAFAWVAWTRRSTSLSLPPSITHIRFQRWKVSEDNIVLDDQKDVEWNQNRAQIFKFHLKRKQCLVSEPTGINVISLEDYKVKEKIAGKRLLGIAQDDNPIFQEMLRSFYGFDLF